MNTWGAPSTRLEDAAESLQWTTVTLENSSVLRRSISPICDVYCAYVIFTCH